MSAAANPSEWIATEWAGSLLEAAEAVGAPTATCGYTKAPRTAVEPSCYWWAQELNAAPGAMVWVGAPEATWKDIGTRCLEALDISSPGEAEVRETWREVVIQSLSGLARRLSAILPEEVLCLDGRETETPPAALGVPESLVFTFEGAPGTELYFLADESLLRVCPGGASLGPSAAHGNAVPSEAHGKPGGVASMVNIEMPISLSFGRVYLTLEEAMALKKGSIVPLNRAVNAPGELKMNRRTFGRGPIVEASGFYGITVEEFCRGERTEKGRVKPASVS